MKRMILAGCLLAGALLAGCGQPSVEDLVARGAGQMDVGKLDDAKLTLGQALNRQPYNAEALFQMGRVYQAEKAYAQAIYYYQCALNSQPSHVGARTCLQRVREQAGADGGSFLSGQ